jgi:hypothetical protein
MMPKFKVMFWAADDSGSDDRIDMSCVVEAEDHDVAGKKVWNSLALGQNPDPFAAAIIPLEDAQRANVKNFCKALAKALREQSFGLIDPKWLRYIDEGYSAAGLILDDSEKSSIDGLEKALAEALQEVE